MAEKERKEIESRKFKTKFEKWRKRGFRVEYKWEERGIVFWSPGRGACHRQHTEDHWGGRLETDLQRVKKRGRGGVEPWNVRLWCLEEAAVGAEECLTRILGSKRAHAHESAGHRV